MQMLVLCHHTEGIFLYEAIFGATITNSDGKLVPVRTVGEQFVPRLDPIVAYVTRIRGDRADNVEKAIAAFEAALTVRMREALPREHLQTTRLLDRARLEPRR